MSSINLVSTNVVGLEKELKRLKIFRVVAAICLIIVSSLSVLAFVLNITLPIESVKKQQQGTLAEISLFHKKLTQYTLLSDRVKNISNIISKRENYVPQANAIFGKIPSDATIDEFNIQAGKITLGVSSTSLLSINKVIDDIVAFGAKGEIIKNVIIQGLTLSVESGRYSLSIQADVP
jgi:competence protein ComGC